MTHASAEQLYDLERQVRALAEEVDEARRVIPQMRAALLAARDALKAWEGMGAMDEAQREESWRLYQDSPEMKTINAAIIAGL